MAAHRARDAARQLKDDIKHSMRITSRSKERSANETQPAMFTIGMNISSSNYVLTNHSCLTRLLISMSNILVV